MTLALVCKDRRIDRLYRRRIPRVSRLDRSLSLNTYRVPEELLPVDQKYDAGIRRDKTFDPAGGNSACVSLLPLVGEFDIVFPRRTDLAVSRRDGARDGSRFRLVGR